MCKRCINQALPPNTFYTQKLSSTVNAHVAEQNLKDSTSTTKTDFNSDLIQPKIENQKQVESANSSTPLPASEVSFISTSIDTQIDPQPTVILSQSIGSQLTAENLGRVKNTLKPVGLVSKNPFQDSNDLLRLMKNAYMLRNQELEATCSAAEDVCVQDDEW
ncbi:hypothetical protein BKA69DRAFT_1127223 [Paraphysoderma sedebokerense]|nr:hypothetical protein BKA69DRAFT_1127223 [Paraphysoderma sedebokerense]